MWYRGVVEGANCFMARSPRGEVDGSFLRHEAGDSKRSDDESGTGGTAVLIGCRRMQKQNGRSCCKVSVRLVSGTCVTVTLEFLVSYVFLVELFTGVGAIAAILTAETANIDESRRGLEEGVWQGPPICFVAEARIPCCYGPLPFRVRVSLFSLFILALYLVSLLVFFFLPRRHFSVSSSS